MRTAVATPMLAGFFRPVLLLPEDEPDDGQLRFVFAHELTHYRQKDLPLKLAALAAASLHWFNPVVHLMRAQISGRCEFACDEYVVRDMTQAQRVAYGRTILDLAAAARPSCATPFSLQKDLLKGRLTRMLQSKRSSPPVRAAAGIIFAAIVCSGLTASSLISASGVFRAPTGAAGPPGRSAADAAPVNSSPPAREDGGALSAEEIKKRMDAISAGALRDDLAGTLSVSIVRGMLPDGWRLDVYAAGRSSTGDPLRWFEEVEDWEEGCTYAAPLGPDVAECSVAFRLFDRNGRLQAASSRILQESFPDAALDSNREIPPLRPPVAGSSKPTVGFGEYYGHTGVDFFAPTGAEITSAAAGTVILVVKGGTGYGSYLIIDHGDNIYTLYGHCSRIDVAVGDRVLGGQKIAAAGATGNATGPMCHFELRQAGTSIDPTPYWE